MNSGIGGLGGLGSSQSKRVGSRNGSMSGLGRHKYWTNKTIFQLLLKLKLNDLSEALEDQVK